jgi:hypothetical protein
MKVKQEAKPGGCASGFRQAIQTILLETLFRLKFGQTTRLRI